MNDFDLYYLSYNDVICLPSFTSTIVSKILNFESTQNYKTVNNTSQYNYPVKNGINIYKVYLLEF